MFPTSIINRGCRVWGVRFGVWGLGCGEIIGKTKKKASYQRDKVEKLD
ncbi:MAG: hypothetical protein QNJ68_01960 [Microcoleaceae cyanobacterium MO_207.B10]|nr:hypothetical protein [Microcoleaceae cyanobacterium MO_207.B10]